jgi:hypothetical protein
MSAFLTLLTVPPLLRLVLQPVKVQDDVALPVAAE